MPEPRDLVVVDCETNGLNPDVHVAVEVGWVNMTTGEEGSFVPMHHVPTTLANADVKALQVNRYIDRLAETKQDDKGVEVRRLSKQLHGAALAGANPWFDKDFLINMFEGYDEIDLLDGAPPVWHHRLPDVENYGAGVLGIDLLTHELPGLATVCVLLGVENPAQHTALADARAAAECFRRLFGLIDERSVKQETNYSVGLETSGNWDTGTSSLESWASQGREDAA